MRRRRRLRYAEALFGGVLCVGAFLPLGAQEVDRYPLSALERLPILTPAPEPVLRIGLGDSEDEIIGRLVQARLLPGGGVALLDRTDRRGTRIFDARGRLRHRIAREGEGPGEVQLSGMHDLQVEEDGSVLFFSRGRHVIRYSPEGELDLHLTLREMGSETTPFGLGGRLQGGDFILLGWAPALPVGPEPILRLDTLEVFRVDTGSGELERIDRLPGYNRVRYAVARSVGGGTQPLSGVGGALAGQGYAWADGVHVVRVDPFRARFEWWEPGTGEVVRAVELGVPERLLDDETRQTLAPRLAGIAPERPGILRESGYPELIPAALETLAELTHRQVIQGVERWVDGRIWISNVYVGDGHLKPGHRLVLSERGRPRAWFRTGPPRDGGPSGWVLDVLGDLVLMRFVEGATGVEWVEVRELRELRFLPPEK